MNKFKNKKNLMLEYMEEDPKDNKIDNPVVYDKNKMLISNYSDSLSCEIGIDGVTFKKDDIAVGKKGVKKITTGKFMSMIDPKKLTVKLNLI